MRVVIVGAGIGGLTLALVLHKAGFEDVVVLEQRLAVQELGAGVQLSNNGSRVLIELGLQRELDRVGCRSAGIWYKDLRTDEFLFNNGAGDWGEREYGSPYYLIHRAHLQQLLLQNIPPHWVRPGSRVIGVADDSSDRVEVHMEDGQTVTADLVVGADGLNSQVRQYVSGYSLPEFAGAVGWRTLISESAVRHLELESACHAWIGPDRILTIYPVASGKALNFLAVVPSATPAAESWSNVDVSAALGDSFSDGCAKVRELVAAVSEPFLTGIFDRPNLETFAKGRVVLLGDAAHPFVPYLAAGATQAIEDAYALGTILEREIRRGDGVDRALSTYQNFRMPRVHQVQERSRDSLKRLHLREPGDIRRRNEAYRREQELDPNGRGYRGWLWGYDVVREVDRLVSGQQLAS